ncbi:hypothetical protein SAMN05216480_10616 [Pustulibacterium marinum]|uniref:Uncharacterized protein n=1 Tax=Pustulibacterium marinum TaxID=1224947 RepID=A0A1I7GVE1_9FLAO|nr:hypothetical protein [Pustulibacterium marinum]SFU52427.1 hypothetical protein SAMN05216480_10616 [Pustulibacterium marinum]
MERRGVKNKTLHKCLRASYFIGFPCGLLFIYGTLLLIFVGGADSILLFIFIINYAIPTVGLCIAFLFALYFATKVAYTALEKENSIWLVSFKYSATVNIICWGTFILLLLFNIDKEVLMFLVPPVLMCIVCTLLTSVSLGLFMAHQMSVYYNNALRLVAPEE